MFTEKEKNTMPLVKLEHLTYELDDGFIVLDDLSTGFYKGEKVIVTGSKGSGKSTLLALISGIYTTQLGAIYFGGEKLSDSLRGDISYTSSGLSLKDWRTPAQFKKLLQCFFQNFSDGTFDKLIKKFQIDENEKISSMSSQNQELLRMIMAFSRKCSLYVLDEPLESFSLEERTEILSFFFDMAKDSCIIAVTESSDSSNSLFTKLLSLKGGKIETFDSINYLELKKEGFPQGFSDNYEGSEQDE